MRCSSFLPPARGLVVVLAAGVSWSAAGAGLQLDSRLSTTPSAAAAKPAVSPTPKVRRERAVKPVRKPAELAQAAAPAAASVDATDAAAAFRAEAAEPTNDPAAPGQLPDADVLALPSTDAPPASLGAVLQRVFDTHPQVQQALAEVESTRFGIDSARAGYYPFVQVQSAVADRAEDGATTISLVQPLWDGGLTAAQIREARQRREAAFAALTQTRINLSQEVITATFEVLGAEAQLELWDQYLASLQKSRTTIERRAEQGVSPEADVQTVLVRISLAESGRETARTQRIAARSRLSSLMSQPPPPLAWPEAAARLTPEDLPTLLARVDAHPSMTVDRQAIDIQKAVAEGSKAGIWPQLTLQHRQQLSGAQFDPTADATLFVLQYQTTSGLRGYQRGKLEQARVAAAEQKLAATRAALEAQFRADTAQLLAFATQIASQSRAATAATNLVDSYQRQFEAGRKTWLELLNALREAHDSRVQAANSERGYWQTNARLLMQATMWDRLGLAQYLDPLEAADRAAREADSGFWKTLTPKLPWGGESSAASDATAATAALGSAPGQPPALGLSTPVVDEPVSAGLPGVPAPAAPAPEAPQLPPAVEASPAVPPSTNTP